MIAAIVGLLGGWRAAAFASVAVLAMLCAGTEHYRLNSAQAALAQAHAEQAQQRAVDARALADALANAREAEQAKAEAAAKIATEYERGKSDAQSVADRVAAGMRAGSLRLRSELAGCQARALPEASARPAGVARAIDDGAAIAGAAVGAGAECDAKVRALQALLISERQ